MFMAAQNDHVDIIKLLAHAHADPDGHRDETPPIVAGAGKQHAAVVTALIGLGADVDAVADDGMTALMWAANNGDLKTTRLLVDGGASKTVKNKSGKTARQIAQDLNHDDVAEVLQ